MTHWFVRRESFIYMTDICVLSYMCKADLMDMCAKETYTCVKETYKFVRRDAQDSSVCVCVKLKGS